MIEQFSAALTERPLWALLLSFGAGFVASLTPCVYPILPITISFFSRRSKTHRDLIGLAILYMMGMVITYTTLGLIAALTGKVFGTLTMTPLIWSGVGSLIVILAAVQMGWIHIRIPSRLIPHSKSAFVMGLSSGLIAAPCTAPILGGILTFIATTQNLLYGGMLMFSFSVGLSLILICLALFTGFISRLPKSGPWLLWIERGSGVLFLGVGLYFIYLGLF